MKQITIKICPDGIVLADTQSMIGHECQKYVKELELLTDAVAVDSKYKEEFYIENSISNEGKVVEENFSHIKRNINI